MTLLLKPCRKHREDLCAVLSGDLPAGDRVRLENHLEACADCQRYREQIGSVTTLLAARSEFFPDVEPREATRMRWTRELERVFKPSHSNARRVFRGFLDWSREMVWPCRRTWAAMMAIWVVVLVLNAWPGAKEEARTADRPSPQIMRALLAREGLLPEAGRTTEHREAERPRPPATQPRSEQRLETKPS